jgi:hypothetical protein
MLNVKKLKIERKRGREEERKRGREEERKQSAGSDLSLFPT